MLQLVHSMCFTPVEASWIAMSLMDSLGLNILSIVYNFFGRLVAGILYGRNWVQMSWNISDLWAMWR